MIDGRWALAALVLVAGCDRAPEQPAQPVEGANPAAAEPAPTPGPSPLPAPEPVLTSLERANCRMIEENREEGGYARFECPGRDGYRLEVVEADAREDLALIPPGGAPLQLQLPSSIAGGAFSTLGKTVEWIGADRLIVRYDVFEAPEGKSPTSYLLVIDLAAAPACVVAQVPPGPDQNERARAIANQKPQPVCIARPNR